MVSIDAAKAVLQPFLFTPTKPQYIREIERNATLSYERVHYYLNELEKIKAVAGRVRGNIKEYSINAKHELVLKIFSLLENERTRKFFYTNPRLGVQLTNLVSKLLVAFQGQSAVPPGVTRADIKFIILFGSTARGEATPESDIDVLIAVKNKDENSEPAATLVGREMKHLIGKSFSLHVIEVEELRKNWKRQPFYSSMWLDRIVLYGDENFWRETLDLGEPT